MRFKSKTMSRSENSIINLTSSIGSSVLVDVFKILCRTVFIYTLGKSYLGITSLFGDILTLLSLAELGLDSAINYRLYKPLRNGDSERVRVLMKFYKNAYMTIGAVILVFGIAFIPAIPFVVKDYETFSTLNINPIVVYLILLSNSVCSYMFFAYKSAIIKADQKNYITTIVNTIARIILNITQIITLLLFKSFILYTVLAVFEGIGANYVNARIAVKRYPQFFQKTSDSLKKDEIKDLFKDLLALFINKVNGVVLKATDNLVISTFIGLSAVGEYSNYLLIYTTITGFLQKVYTSIRASMGNLFAGDDMEKKYSFFKAMNLLTVVMYGTAFVFVSTLANEFINCWIGPDYIIDKWFPVLIGVEIIFVGLKLNLGVIRNVAGAFRQMWYRPLFGIVINLTVSISLVRKIGMHGVIIGTISSDILTSFLFDPAIVYKHVFNAIRKPSEYYRDTLGYFAVLLIATIINYFSCQYVLPGHDWITFAVHLLICFVSVPGIFLLIYCRTKEGIYLLGFVKGIFNKVKRIRKDR